jgi:hypothetical protein
MLETTPNFNFGKFMKFKCLLPIFLGLLNVLPLAAKEIHLLGVGDILIHQPLKAQGVLYQKGEGFKTLWKETLPYIKKADLAYGNIEGPMADDLAPQTAQFSFNFPSFLAGNMKDSGFDIVSTTNNHSLDRGLDGVLQTIDTLDDYRLPFVGTRKSLDSFEGFYKVLKVKGVRMGFIACTDVKNMGSSQYVADCSLHQNQLASLIHHLKTKEKVEGVVLTPHWGAENQTTASSRQRSLARFFFSKGVDVIIGAHPHVLQNSEILEVSDVFGQKRNRLVLYSLGNFVSNQLYFGLPQRVGALANIYFDSKKGFKSYDVIPTLMHGHPFRVEVIKSKNHEVTKWVEERGLQVK